MTVRRAQAARLRAVPDIDELMTAAREAAGSAYAPYSRFRVGSAVRTGSGAVYTGVNVENASYPVGVCAESSAIAAAILAEGPKMRLAAVAVAAESGGRPRPCSPCGACRQRIAEFGREAEVSFLGAGLQRIAVSAEALLPHCFTFPAEDEAPAA